MPKKSEKNINHFLPSIILFKPQLGKNIGSVARAMKNFGLYDLRLVEPRDGWPNADALTTAAGADDIINNAKVYINLEESVEDISFLAATSARKRYLRKKISSPISAAKLLFEKFKKDYKCAILFGPENSGLTNKEISLSDLVVVIPLNPKFSSLNLSQAVLLMIWEFRKLLFIEGIYNDDSEELTEKNKNRSNLVDINEREFFFERLESLLDEKQFFPTKEMKSSIMSNIKDVFIRSKLSKQEISTFHGIISAFEKKIKT